MTSNLFFSGICQVIQYSVDVICWVPDAISDTEKLSP